MANKLIDTFKQTADTIAFLDRGYGIKAPDVQKAIEYIYASIIRESPSMNMVSVRDFGAVGDGITDDTEAIKNAIEYGIANNLSVYIPSGLYLLNDHIYITNITGNVHIYGDGVKNTILKMNDGVGNRRILFLSNKEGAEANLLLHDITFDHNQEGQNPPEGWEWESTATVQALSTSVRGWANIVVKNCVFLNPIADCFNASSGSSNRTFGSIYLHNITARTRKRVRFDLCITGAWDLLSIDHCDVNCIRTEVNGATPSHRHDTFITNTRVMDSDTGNTFVVGASGDWSELRQHPPILLVDNCFIQGNLYLYKYYGIVSNSTVVYKKEGRIMQGRWKFSNCHIIADGYPVTNANGVIHNLGGACEHLTIDNCSFTTRNMNNQEVIGYFIKLSLPLPEKSKVIITNCAFEGDLMTLYARDCYLYFRGNTIDTSINDLATIQFDAVSNELIAFIQNNHLINPNSFLLYPNRTRVKLYLGGNKLEGGIEKIFNNTGTQGSLLTSDFDNDEGTNKNKLLQPESEFRLSPPNSGYVLAGTIVYSLDPANTGAIGWICTTKGTNGGTWTKFGLLEESQEESQEES